VRVGGGSQDSTPYSADAPNTDSIVTNADFAYLRNTIDILNTRPAFDAAPPWGVVLGAAMTPSSTPANAKSFLQGVATVFAGADIEATERARSYFTGYGPSSPSIAILKDGELVYMLERYQIEGRDAHQIAGELTNAFDEHC